MDAGYGNWTTLWPYAVLLSVLGVWAVYHFLAPSTWRDWAGAGLVQASSSSFTQRCTDFR